MKNPALTVDVIIEYDDGSVILIERGNDPFKGSLALPGGFVEYGETVESAAMREAKEETGLEVELVGLVGVYSDPNRDPRGHTVSVVFRGRVTGGEMVADTDAADVVRTADYFARPLAFDHEQILREAFGGKRSQGNG